MKVTVLTCTYNRHLLLERLVGCFIDQDYEGDLTLHIMNSGKHLELALPPLPEGRKIELWNNAVDQISGEPYKNVGDKHRDNLWMAPKSDVYVHMCDDDYMLPNYVKEGVKGLEKFPHMDAYKPRYSYFRTKDLVTLHENVMEPSIFIRGEALRKYGYLKNSVKYMDAWLYPLIQQGKIVTDGEGVPTLVYDWSGEHPAFRLSGRGTDDDRNFIDSQRFDGGEDDGILTPLTHEELQKYYNLIPK